MALSQPRADLHAPPFSKTFTDFTADLVLHSTSAPANAQHLPASIFVIAEAADVLAFLDANGQSNTLAFTAGFYGTLPFTIATITNTTTTVTSVTASWHPEP
jgi:hypothetical protein